MMIDQFNWLKFKILKIKYREKKKNMLAWLYLCMELKFCVSELRIVWWSRSGPGFKLLKQALNEHWIQDAEKKLWSKVILVRESGQLFAQPFTPMSSRLIIDPFTKHWGLQPFSIDIKINWEWWDQNPNHKKKKEKKN